MGDEATLVGEVQSVSGSTVSVRLRRGLSSLALVRGESYRVGQVGEFLRIPLGYSQLFGVCSQVGAAALPHAIVSESEIDGRWLTLILFGESIGGDFQRGVSQFPTFGDEVHLVTHDELQTIYGAAELGTPLSIGSIASASGIDARIDLGRLVGRHSAVVGSSGAGKSNLVTVILEAISDQGYDTARVIVLDPHGEYSSAVGDAGQVFSVTPDDQQSPLQVPFWALPFDEFLDITLGAQNQANETAIRDAVNALRRDAAPLLDHPPDPTFVSADSPVPFSAKNLWFHLSDDEHRTYANSERTQPAALTAAGDPDLLIANQYPAPAPGNAAPYRGHPRGIDRSLDLMRSRLRDTRYSFLFEPGPELTPDLQGKTEGDLDQLVASWIGHDRPVTVIDLSGAPADVLSLVTGTVLRIIYDALFWACDLPIGGREQPLLVVLEEAHLFLSEGTDSAAQRTIAKIAKEGRKYGVGLMLVTQRPTELDATALSQCGTMIALRLTNQSDRSRVTSTMPDDLANLAALLPSLRTGEALLTGEAIPIPSRIRIPEASRKPIGRDPDLGNGWRDDTRPNSDHYATAVANWRALRSVDDADAATNPDEEQPNG